MHWVNKAPILSYSYSDACLQPVLKTFQEHNKPEYIQLKAREKLEAEGFFKEPDAKKRRPDSPDGPMTRQSSTPLPDQMEQPQKVNIILLTIMHILQMSRKLRILIFIKFIAF